jgi:hypothetical protein
MSKKCKVCKTPFTPRFSTLQPICEEFKCIMEWKRILEEKAWQKRKKEAKEKLKSLSEYEAEAKKSFQKWVRLRDEGLPCISCGTMETMRWDGGHLFKAEIFSGVIFDERNVSRQCIKCNTVLNGNEAEYSIRLKERIGEKEFLSLQQKAMLTRNTKYTKEELVEIKKRYDKRKGGQ